MRKCGGVITEVVAVVKIITVSVLGYFKTRLETLIEELVAGIKNVPEEDVGGNIWIEAGESNE